MKAPSTKRLLENFPHLTREQATLIRKLAHAADDRDVLPALIKTHCPATHAYARSCYNDPFDSYMWRVTMALHAIDCVLGTHGVEALGEVDTYDGPPYEYCNTGDTYATTLIYCRDVDALRIGSWGDIAERMGGDES